MPMSEVISSVNQVENPTKVAILMAAKAAITEHGYKAVSFRDLAAAVGIKSASVHYHYPTKNDLALALIQHYRGELEQALELPKRKKNPAQKALNKFLDGVRERLSADKAMSLDVVLASDSHLLNEECVDELNEIMKLQLDYLATLVSYMSKEWLTSEDTYNYAHQILASVQGAMLLTRVSGDIAAFDSAIAPWRDLAGRF
jgi:TetR/AcrR family transcriptional repressor of nem operon